MICSRSKLLSLVVLGAPHEDSCQCDGTLLLEPPEVAFDEPSSYWCECCSSTKMVMPSLSRLNKEFNLSTVDKETVKHFLRLEDNG